MKRNFDLLLAVLVAAGILAGSTFAAVPLLLSHQGRLLDAADLPVNGVRDITFKIYETETGGAPLWTEPHLDVPVTDGLFHVTLGSSITISGDLIVTAGTLATERWLELQVEGETLTPRMRLGATPYAVGASRLSGDVETLPGELSVSAMSGSTTGTIRSSSNPGDPGSELELVDGNGSTTGTIRAAGNTGAQVHLTGMSGSTTATIRASSDPGNPGSQVFLVDGNGSTTGTIRMQASLDSALTVHTKDVDGDGVIEHTVWQKVDNSDARVVAGTDLNGDSSPDVVCRSLTDSSHSEHALNFYHDANNGEGHEILDIVDVASASSTLSGLRGIGGNPNDLTGTIRMQATPDSAITVYAVKLEGDGQADGQANIAALLNGNVVIGCKTDVDDDGDDDNEAEISCDATSARSIFEGRSGSTTGTIRMAATPDSTVEVRAITVNGELRTEMRTKQHSNGGTFNMRHMSGSTTGTIRMAASSDSTRIQCDSDLDGDGIAQGSYKLQSGFIYSSQQLAFDSDDDGLDEGSLEEISDVSGARSTFIGRSGSTTGTIRMAATSDSAGNYLDHDDDGDGIPEAFMKTFVEQAIASMQASCRSGSTTGTIRMAATSDSAVTVHAADLDGDGHDGAILVVAATDQFGNRSSSMHLDVDSDDDGDADNEAELSCDSTGARSILSGMSGSTTGTIRMAATPDSTVFDLGYSGSTTATIRLLACSSSTANPIEHSSGAHLTFGGDWTNASDRNLKENFTKVDGEELLEIIEELPISQWNYKNEDESITHIGPTAQDFKKAFGLGANDKSISTVDPSGIALAAIKELNKQNKELANQNKELKKELENLKKKVDELISRR